MGKKLIARKASGKGPNDKDPEKPYWQKPTPGRPGWNIAPKAKKLPSERENYNV